MADIQTNEDEQAVQLELRDGSYLLSVFVSPGVTLSVEVEHKSDGNRWRGDFTARYIEEITQRAGNVKSFSNFIKMLRTATASGCKSLNVDVLTYQDLETLKDRNASSREISFSNVAAAHKRYLILTYTTEFDRVHYPLPLLREEVSETVAMRRCIQSLQNELESVKCRLRKSKHPQNLHHRSKNVASSEENQCSNSKLLQEKVKGLEDKLRTEGLSLKKSITILLRKNTLLQEEAKQARAAERRLSEKLRDSEYQLGLMRGRLKMQGVANKASPFRSSPRTSASPRPSPHRTRTSASPPPSLSKTRNPASPPPSRYIQRRTMGTPPTSRNAQFGRPFLPSRSHMSSPRYSNSTSYLRRSENTSRSHSCPNLGARKTMEMNEWRARKLKQSAATTTITTPRRRNQNISHEPIIRGSNNCHWRGMEDVTDEVGEIDSRLYALRDYLKSINA